MAANRSLGERVRLASVTTVVGAIPAGAVTAKTGLWSSGFGVFVLNLSAAATDVGDTLDIYVDTSIDGGTTWINIIHFAQLLGNGGAKQFAAAITPSANVGTAPVDVSADAAAGAIRHYLGDQFRVRYVQVDADSDAAFTFTVDAYLY